MNGRPFAYIQSDWIFDRQDWRKEPKAPEVRTLGLVLIHQGDKRIIQFMGGPTGHESYNLAHLLEEGRSILDRSGEFCICAGCHNYATCHVQICDVQDFIQAALEAECYL